MKVTVQYHTHRIIEVYGETKAECDRLVEAELHDDEWILSDEVMETTDDN